MNLGKDKILKVKEWLNAKEIVNKLDEYLSKIRHVSEYDKEYLKSIIKKTVFSGNKYATEKISRTLNENLKKIKEANKEQLIAGGSVGDFKSSIIIKVGGNGDT